MAAVAISDATDGRRILALSGRLDATTIRGVWDESRRAIAAAPDQRVVVDAADVDYCDGAGIALLVDLIAARKRRATSRSRTCKPGIRDAAAAVRSAQALGHDLDPPAPRQPGRRGDRRHRRRHGAKTCASRSSSSARPPPRWYTRCCTRDDSLEGRVAHLRARRRRRAADRRADLVPARRDPRVPVGDPDEALRRRDLRRRPDRARDAARARAR